jgi:hypothetical protein
MQTRTGRSTALYLLLHLSIDVVVTPPQRGFATASIPHVEPSMSPSSIFHSAVTIPTFSGDSNFNPRTRNPTGAGKGEDFDL